MNIIPAILEASYQEIENKIESVLHDIEKVHIDICDGLFVSRKTWPYSASSNNRIEENYQIKKLLNEEIGLPNWDSINYEFDLMVQNPDIQQDIWARIGANVIIIHPTSFKDEAVMLDFIKEIDSFMIDIVIAVTYEEYFKHEEVIKDLLNRKIIKSLQIMTIKNIGSQGQKFDERCFALIEKIKTENPDTLLRVDGGVNTNNIEKIIDLNVDEIIIGSAIFNLGNSRENLNYFKDLC
jgi:ribulose-phosphate 3-epimerase